MPTGQILPGPLPGLNTTRYPKTRMDRSFNRVSRVYLVRCLVRKFPASTANRIAALGLNFYFSLIESNPVNPVNSVRAFIHAPFGIPGLLPGLGYPGNPVMLEPCRVEPYLQPARQPRSASQKEVVAVPIIGPKSLPSDTPSAGRALLVSANCWLLQTFCTGQYPIEWLANRLADRLKLLLGKKGARTCEK